MESLIFLFGFMVIALASERVGRIFTLVKLPLISGFLFTGIIAGPFVLDLIHHGAIEKLQFIEEISLAFIAFAAGSELYLKELRSRFKSITWVTIGLVVSTFTLGSIAVVFLADFIPFMPAMSLAGQIGVAILAGAILVARSPSDAIAIINELRAKGPFTQTVLGVTVIMDVVVITLFAINLSIADALLTGLHFNFGFVAFTLIELLISAGVGVILAKIIQFILSRHMRNRFKIFLILLAGYSIFLISIEIRHNSPDWFGVEVLLEPLLICMIASFSVTNYSDYRTEFLQVIQDSGRPIYVAFFTLTGASLALDILVETWGIALALFGVRLVGIMIGSFGGGVIAKEPLRHNQVRWMAFVTQAGVGLGLAQEVAVVFPDWGEAFATIIISVIVLNESIGPISFKWAVSLIGEAHPRAEMAEFDGIRDAVIFGLEGQSLALARQLQRHGWRVKIATRKLDIDFEEADIDIYPIKNLDLETLHHLDIEHTEAIVAMLSDEDNYHICELVYEHFGTNSLIVRLNHRENILRFQELDTLIVDPSTAMVNLLDQFVRSRSAASMLLGLEEDHQELVDIEINNPDLDGIILHDLRLPLDTLILSVRRNGHSLICHGYTQLALGDWVTIVGSPESLDAVMLRFDAS